MGWLDEPFSKADGCEENNEFDERLDKIIQLKRYKL